MRLYRAPLVKVRLLTWRGRLVSPGTIWLYLNSGTKKRPESRSASPKHLSTVATIHWFRGLVAPLAPTWLEVLAIQQQHLALFCLELWSFVLTLLSHQHLVTRCFFSSGDSQRSSSSTRQVRAPVRYLMCNAFTNQRRSRANFYQILKSEHTLRTNFFRYNVES